MKKIFLLMLGLSLFFTGKSISVDVVTPGKLNTLVTDKTVASLILTGTIDASDIKFMRDELPNLLTLDMRDVTIAEYTGENGTGSDFSWPGMPVSYAANQLPAYSFSADGMQISPLNTLLLPNSVSFLNGMSPFNGCNNLTSLTIGDGITNLMSNVLMGLNNLTSLNVGNGIEFFDANVLNYFSKLSILTLGNNVLNLDIWAFNNAIMLGELNIGSENRNYSSLDGVVFDKLQQNLIFCPMAKKGNCTLPATLTSIPDYFFQNRTGITSITSKLLAPGSIAMGSGVFDGVDKNLCTLYVPSNTLSLYAALPQWQDFIHKYQSNGLWLSASTVNVAKNANSVASVTVNSNASWTSTSDQSWLSVTSGATGYAPLNLTAVTTNPLITIRTATVTVKATGVIDNIITVSQLAGDATTASVAKKANSTTNVSLTSTASWTATSDQSWLTVTPSGPTGNATLTLTAVATNLFVTTRTATVIIKASGSIDKKITVTQAAGDATLSVSAATASLTKTANSTTNVNVTSNTTWTATSDQSWLSVTSGASGNATLTLTASIANPLSTTRTAIVTVKATGVADKIITVTQAVGDPTLSVSATTVGISKTANSTATVDVTSNTIWTATSDQSWLTVNSGGTGNAQLTFTAITTNLLITPRSAMVTLKAAGVADKIITLTQSAGDAVIQIASTSVTIDKTINSSTYVNVTSNAVWTAASNQSWLSVSPGATGNGLIIVTSLSENTTVTPRVALVTLKATGATDKIITVTQEAVTPVVTVDNNSVIINPANNYSASVNITTNTVWTASSDQNWLTLSPVSSNILTFSSTAATEIRQAIVTLKAAGVADTRITVVQSPSTANKYRFNMTVTSIATIDKLEITNNNIQLSAFIGNESRGTASLKYDESSKRYMAFIMVWGNADDVNKTITFKSYDPISTKELLATNSTLKFLPENITGSPTTPYSIDFFDKITNTANKQLTLKVYLEGLWNGTNMNKCKEYDVILGDVVDKFAGSVVDTLSVELHNATYSNIAYRITGLQLNQDGTVHSAGKPYIEVPDAASGNYHITIRTRNHLETTTRALVPFSGSTVTYDFTDAVTKAFESNASFTPMKQIDGKWMLYSGNTLPMDPPQVNSDAIDFIDLYDIINNSSDFTSEYGYLVSDLNGDGSVDFLDIYDFVMPNYDSGIYFNFPE